VNVAIYKKIQNGGLMLIGGMAVLISLLALVHHRYVFFYHRGQRWVPTLVPLLGGAWLFVVGLIGFLDDKKPRDVS
jgi:hypothetical protein